MEADLYFDPAVKDGNQTRLKNIKKTTTTEHRLYFFSLQTRMPCELNPRALYPRLARIVFDLASIRGGRASCEREETVCVSGGRKTQGKTRGTSVSVCCSLFLFFFFLYTNTVVNQE